MAEGGSSDDHTEEFLDVDSVPVPERKKGSKENKEQKKRFEELKGTVVKLSSENEELKNNFAKMESENKELEGQRVELEATNLKLQNETTSLRRELEESRKRVLEGMKGREREKETKLEAMREMEARIEALRREKDARIEVLKKEKDETLEALKKEREEMQEALDKVMLASKVDTELILESSLRDELEAKGKETKALKKHVEELEALVGSGKSSKTELETKMEKMKRQISKLARRSTEKETTFASVNPRDLGIIGGSAIAVVAAVIGIVRCSNAGKKQ